MSSTFGIFESAKSGLSVAMQQLNVTEQNISNVNTEGYTRQRMLTSAKEPATSVYLIAQLNKNIVGQGVEATGIQQIRSAYLDQQYRTLNGSYSYSASRNDSLSYLTGLFNELNDDSSLTSAISNFASSLKDFAKDTSSKSYRTNVQQQALSMTQSFNNVYEEMQSLWHEQNDSINSVTQKINSIGQKIASLNEAIASAVQTAGTANDLNDERNLLIDQLSGYANITYSLNASNDNMVDIKIGGLTLVDGKTANAIVVESSASHKDEIDSLTAQIAALNKASNDDASTVAANQASIGNILTQLRQYMNVVDTPNAGNSSLIDVTFNGIPLVNGEESYKVATAVSSDLDTWISFNRNNLTLNGMELSLENGTVKNGQLYSNMEMITGKDALSPGIPYFMDQLNTYVRDIAENLNTINRSGWTYPDGSAASKNGVNFFEVSSYTDGSGNTVYDYSKVTAGNFTLSDEVLQSAYNIAGSSKEIILTGDSPQSGNNEIASQLFDNLVNNGYDDKLNSIIGSLSIAANTGGSIMSTKQSLLRSVDTQRKSVSAVSLDEETTNLIIFQQSYNAAARIISTLDEMLNTMINNMGVVGR